MKPLLRVVICVGMTGATSVWAAPGRTLAVPAATPLGITIQVPAGSPEVLLMPYRERSVGIQYYADARGMALYTYDKDEANNSSCYGECAQAWPPLIAPRGAKAFGDWGLIKRKGGGRQWTLQGKPLYTFVKDSLVGVPTGAPPPVDPREERYKELVNGKKAKKKRDEEASAAEAANKPSTPWRLASYSLAQVTVPNGITVEEVVDANGEALTANGMTLYVFEGTPGHEDASCASTPCASPWIPFPAPWLANSTGDFTFINRQDGIRQWAYKGKGLYTFKGDLSAGDAKGIGIDKLWRAALVKQFYMPSQVRIRDSLGQGKVLATLDGMTLYRHTYSFNRSLPRDTSVRPEMGRVFGTRSCDEECAKTWLPLEAPRKAQPCGFWEILTRADGRRQWSYKGYALYRYAGDQEPGDVGGESVRTVVTNNDLDVSPNAITAVASAIDTHNQVVVVWSHMFP